MVKGCLAHTLDGRLLCASECAEQTRPSQRFWDGVGWSNDNDDDDSSSISSKRPKPYRISHSVNSCLVGWTIDGIVIAFRGTQPNSLDWLQNAAIFMTNIHNIPGKIHSGFHTGALNLYEPLKAAVLKLIEVGGTNLEQQQQPSLNTTVGDGSSTTTTNKWIRVPSPPRILLTGHSKGASLASLTAVIMNLDPDLPNIHYVASFGGARVGDAIFQEYFNKTIRQRSYENNLDIVPFLPPGKEDYDVMGDDMKKVINELLWSNHNDQRAVGYHWGYQPIGYRRYIDEFHQFHDHITKQLDHERIHDIECNNHLNLNSFHCAHCLTCPNPDKNCSGGYFCSVAPEICTMPIRSSIIIVPQQQDDDEDDDDI